MLPILRGRPVVLRGAAALLCICICIATMLCAGCRGKVTEDPIQPGEPPAEKAKDSMDYYRDNMMQGGS